MKKKLIFSNLQNFDLNNKDNFYLGTWVFLGNKNIDKILEKKHFPKTYNNEESLVNSDYLINLSTRLINILSKKYNHLYGYEFSYEYWKILIGPAIIYYVQIMFEKYSLINSILLNEIKFVKDFLKLLSKISINRMIENKK